MNLVKTLGALLGFSAYARPPLGAPDSLGDAKVEERRKAFGGNLVPLAYTQTRWYLKDLEEARHAADGGLMAPAARLYKAFRQDGTLSGLLATRTGGLVRLPKKFRGDAEVKRALETRDGVTARSVFDDMFPPSELALLAADGICLGVGVGEMRRVEGRDFPVFVRMDPEYLVYRWNENRWYYQSIIGLLPITPGDGNWVLHTPSGFMSPWQNGLWAALGRSWISKDHAVMHRENYGAKLANPARVATAAAGSDVATRENFLSQVMAWGANSTFELPPGYDVKLLESKGEGYKVFQEQIATCDQEIMIALAGQVVTTTGGSGFANANVHAAIRSDLIGETADALAYTINTQGIPQFVVRRWGPEKLQEGSAVVGWEVEPPKNVKEEAESLKAFGEALASLRNGLLPFRIDLDVASLTNRFGVPIANDSTGDGTPDVNGASAKQVPTVDLPLTGDPSWNQPDSAEADDGSIDVEVDDA